MAYTLGLDLGPTSIGWAAIELDSDRNPTGFVSLKNGSESQPAIGSRVFPAGVENLNQGQREQPKNKKRREKRSVRRRLRRTRARRLELIQLLKQGGFLNGQSIEALQQQDPYEIRKKAVEEKISLKELARIFLHFAKRRGFKSNRRQPEDKDAKASDMKKARDLLETELDGQTLGQFWQTKLYDNSKESIRNQRGNYRWIAQRHHYQDELVRIWQVQSKFHPDVLSHGFYIQLEKLLFDQIPFELSNTKKRKVIGTCSLIQGKIRCGYSERIAQKFRMLQKINDIQIQIGGEIRGLNDVERNKLIEILNTFKDRDYSQVRKDLWGKDADKVKINLEYREKEKIKGNEIDSLLTHAPFFDRKKWLLLTENQKDQVWSILRQFLSEILSEKEVEKQIGSFGLSFKKSDWPRRLKEPIGTCNYSKEALNEIVPLMDQSLNLYTAIEKAGFKNEHRQRMLLPLPDKANGFQIPNPIVSSVLFQLRKVVNLLIKEIGLPDKIVIETARELKASKDRRQDIVKKQSLNKKEREKAKEVIREQMGWSSDVDISNTDVMKWRLWEEQNHFCPYSCEKIPFRSLFSRDVEIDHVLPYSMSLDNTMNNKVVCFSKQNQEKGQNTPISWLGTDSSRWQTIQDAMARNAFNFTDAKWERFSVANDGIAENYQPERLLRDTAYITREVRGLLKRLYPAECADQKVQTTKGAITAELRNLWNLNPILRDGELGPKNRDDLRHHAIDAAVIAVTNQRAIQKITKTLQENWPKRSKYAAIAEPWEGFSTDLSKVVDTIRVSHRVQRKVKGALHKETNYGLEEHGPNQGMFVTRKGISDITESVAKNICDPEIRELVSHRLDAYKGDAKKAFEKQLNLPNKNGSPTPIRKVRISKNAGGMIELKNNIWVEPGENHHVEIFKREVQKSSYEYICKVWTVWDVAQRVKSQQPVILKQHPGYPDAIFVMSLSKQESIQIADKDGNMQKARVLSVSGQPDTFTKIDMEVRPLPIGDIRNLSDVQKKELRREWRITSLKDFDKRNIQKITVDPIGRVRRAGD